MSYEHPYAGLKVLDLTQGFAGPYCAGLLALYGADVVKVEPPEGDWIRQIGRAFGGQTPLGIVANRGKRCIALDLKKEGGREVALRLAEAADIVLESFRPGVAARLGVGYEQVRCRNPGVLYVSISGFGQDGPYAGRPTTDTVVQAFSGFISVNEGMDGVPHRVGMLVVDTVSGVYAFQALQAALYARRGKDGEGRYLDISLMQSTAAFLAPKIVEHHLENGKPRILNAPAGSYRTRDGWIAVAVIKEEHFPRLCEALGRPELGRDPRFDSFETRAANFDVLKPLLDETFARRTTAEWVERLQAADVLCNPINTFSDWLADPHVKASGTVTTVAQPGAGEVPMPIVPGTTPAADGTPEPVAPAIGEHGREILVEIGFGEGEIAALAAAGAVRLPA